MPSEKFSISTSPELFEALEALAERRDQDRSSLIEMLLREHPMVEAEVRRRRQGPVPGLKKGRDLEEIWALARSARRNWRERTRSGKVRIVD